MVEKNGFDVYCCYASVDLDKVRHCIKEIKSWKKINNVELNCFWDKERILISEDWYDKLDSAMNSSKSFVLFLTKNWRNADWLLYEMVQSIKLKEINERKGKNKENSTKIQIFPLLFEGVEVPAIIELAKINFERVNKLEDATNILRKRIAPLIGAKIGAISKYDRKKYINLNENIPFEAITDKLVVSNDSVGELQDQMLLSEGVTNSTDLSEKDFFIFLDWVRWLRYNGKWKESLELMENALNENHLLPDSTAKIWLDFEYLSLRYESSHNYRPSFFTIKIFNEDINNIFSEEDESEYRVKIKELFKKIFSLIAENKFEREPDKLWLRANLAKALGNMIKEDKKKESIKLARKYCKYAIDTTQKLKLSNQEIFSEESIHVLYFDCYRELANVEIYANKYEKALRYIDNAAEELLRLQVKMNKMNGNKQNKNLINALKVLLYYHWGRLLIICKLYSPFAVGLLERANEIYTMNGNLPNNNVRIASIYSQLGRLLPKIKEHDSFINHDLYKFIENINVTIDKLGDEEINTQKYVDLRFITLIEKGKRNIDSARRLCRDFKHRYTMLKNTLHLIELTIAEMLLYGSKDNQRILKLMSEAQNIYEEVRHEGGYSVEYSNEFLNKMLGDMYEFGLHSCSRLSFDNLWKELNQKYHEPSV